MNSEPRNPIRRQIGALPHVAAAAAALLIGALPAEAQLRPGAAQQRAGQSFLMIGGSQLDLAELNARLATRGYPVFDEQFLQIGFGTSHVRERVLLGFEMAGLLRPSETAPGSDFQTRVTGGYGMLNVGYAAFRDGGVWLAPKVGIGVGGVSLNIHERAAPTFDELLARPGRSVQLTHGSILVDASIGLTYRLQPATTARGPRGLAIGIRGGYSTSALDFGWSTEHQPDVPGGPAARWGGPHVEFTIGRYTGRR